MIKIFVESLFLLVLITLYLFRIKIRYTKNQADTLGIDYNSSCVLKGYAILIIMVHHLVLRMSDPGLLLLFRGVGYLGTSIFLFLSGYGLASQAYGNEVNYIDNLLKKRLFNIYIPAVFINLIYIFILLLMKKQNFNWGQIIWNSIYLYGLDTSTWYIIAAFFWYIAFWVSVKYNTRWVTIIKLLFLSAVIYLFLCLFIGADKNWMDTAFAFPLGAFWSIYRKKFEKTCLYQAKILPISIFVCGLTMFLSFGKNNNILIIFRIIASCSFLLSMILFLKRFDISNNKIMKGLGLASLECYLIHGKIIRIIKSTFGEIGYFQTLLYIISTIIAVFLFYRCMKIYKRLISKYS